MAGAGGLRSISPRAAADGHRRRRGCRACRLPGDCGRAARVRVGGPRSVHGEGPRVHRGWSAVALEHRRIQISGVFQGAAVCSLPVDLRRQAPAAGVGGGRAVGARGAVGPGGLRARPPTALHVGGCRGGAGIRTVLSSGRLAGDVHAGASIHPVAPDGLRRARQRARCQGAAVAVRRGGGCSGNRRVDPLDADLLHRSMHPDLVGGAGPRSPARPFRIASG